MRCLVTGVAGFIGSHLAEALLAQGHSVIGVDCFTDYYAREYKERNIIKLREKKGFQLIEADLLNLNLAALLKQIDWVFHLAAQAGVRASWGTSFEIYTHNNILATQKLLEASKEADLKGFIYASSSSVYGDTKQFPTPERSYLQPLSPYGVTKLAGEHLCYLYYKNFGVPTVALRYFTVYGPRQRPDMAFHRFLKAALMGGEIEIYGDGQQSRDFTYISDIVTAHLLAMEQFYPGEVFNIGGGSQTVLKTALDLLPQITGKEVKITYKPVQKGDVRHTAADITKAQRMLGYQPRVKLPEGLEAEWQWIKEIYK
ncbi:MAG: GDP-mannose 4,6-dehydratase [Candidatus Desulfofervidaceae bacterium]|nr:GDP-mannose 4,6-dehydratase [Candidatus Desulfofervidaceae bacterium]MDL1970948.1 GDP-mannose 4,6-dehydratase [Candidatus Desulfofervidaceae bacterium]